VRILHAGQLYVGRDPRPILDAVAGIPGGSVPPFRFEFLGRTQYAPGADLAAEAQTRGLSESIVCRGQVTYRQTLDEMATADVLLLMDTPNRQIGVPAKLYEYLGAGKPVLATGESHGDLAAILSQSGVPFRIARPNDPVGIRGAIVALVRGVAQGTLPPVDDAARRKFTREALAGQLAELFNRLIKVRS
jgi:glycosyltransferase involved in cell wall biosynthesis